MQNQLFSWILLQGRQRLVWSLHLLTPIQILNPSHRFHLKTFSERLVLLTRVTNSQPIISQMAFWPHISNFAAAATPHKAHFIPQSQSERISGKPELSNHFSGSETDIELWLKSSGNQNALTFFPLIRAGGLGVLCWACRAESRFYTASHALHRHRVGEDPLITAPQPLQPHESAVTTNDDRQGGTVGAQVALSFLLNQNYFSLFSHILEPMRL